MTDVVVALQQAAVWWTAVGLTVLAVVWNVVFVGGIAHDVTRYALRRHRLHRTRTID